MIIIARTLTVEQAYPLVNAVYKQATGQDAIAVIDNSTFTVVAGQLSGLHYNQIAPAMLEVASGLEIVNRPYNAPLKMVWRGEDGYQSRMLKVSYLDNAEAEANPAWTLKDGDKLNVHTVKLPKVYEAEIWGANTIMAHVTITKKQVRTALGSPAALARFYSGLMQNIEDQLEQQKEGMCRATLLSAMNGVYHYNATSTAEELYMKKSTVHLLTEFKAKYGGEFADLAAIRADATAYVRFVKFCFARMNDVAKSLANRDKFYHVNPIKDPKVAGTSGIIPRHTPASMLDAYVSWPLINEISADVLTQVWNTDYLKMVRHEELLFWQSPDDPTSFNVKSTVMKFDGSRGEAAAKKVSNVFAFMHDRDMLGVGVVEQDEGDTPYDQERKAYNRIWDMDVKSWVDFTEKAVLFLLD